MTASNENTAGITAGQQLPALGADEQNDFFHSNKPSISSRPTVWTILLDATSDQRLHHRGIGQGAGVAQVFGVAFGDLAKDATHDFATAGFG